MDLDFTYIMVVFLFSMIGLVAWRYGKKIDNPRHMVLGICLMGFGYVITNPWWDLIVGSGLTILLFWP